jgi:phosphoglycolate phosphatase
MDPSENNPSSLGSRDPYKVILFDLDGTLVDFAYRLMECKTKLTQALADAAYDISKLPPIERSALRDYLDFADTGPVDSRNRVRKKLLDILDYYDEVAIKESKLMPDTEMVLDRLKSLKIRIGLLTNAGKKNIASGLSSRNLGRYMEVVLTRDDVSSMKPSGEMIEKGLEFFKEPASSALYVGDHRVDVLCAQAAKVDVAVIPERATVINEIELLKPTYILGSLRDLLEIPRIKAITEAAIAK